KKNLPPPPPPHTVNNQQIVKNNKSLTFSHRLSHFDIFLNDFVILFKNFLNRFIAENPAVVVYEVCKKFLYGSLNM
ncbi:MAG: hypothetical protein FWC97_03130, partial [Treponema sp.]|nr:hypothetical protein [Treponema sp.]